MDSKWTRTDWLFFSALIVALAAMLLGGYTCSHVAHEMGHTYDLKMRQIDACKLRCHPSEYQLTEDDECWCLPEGAPAEKVDISDVTVPMEED